MQSTPKGHNDSWLGYGSLITVLVAVHVAALLIWLGLLIASERKRREKKQE